MIDYHKTDVIIRIVKSQQLPGSKGSGAAPRGGWARPPKNVAKRVVALLVTALTFYVVLPSLSAVLGSWPRLATLSGVWLIVAVLSEAASFVCNFGIQRIVLRTHGWFGVVTAGLSGNAVTNALPGGAAAGAAVQFRMLRTAGIDADAAVGGLTASSLPVSYTHLTLPTNREV